MRNAYGLDGIERGWQVNMVEAINMRVEDLFGKWRDHFSSSYKNACSATAIPSSSCMFAVADWYLTSLHTSFPFICWLIRIAASDSISR